MSMVLQVTVRMGPEPRAAAVARRFLELTAQAQAIDPDVTSTATLLVSELVTNAIRHAGTDIVMEIMTGSEALRVHVTDGGTDGAVHQPERDLFAENGRGIQLVTALAHDWGVLRTSQGKTVWFDLALTGPQTPAQRTG